MMKLLLTGATGFIGKNFIEKFKNKYEICALISDSTNEQNVSFLVHNKIKYYKFCELSKIDGEIFGCVHLASYGVKYGERDILKMLNTNVVLAAQILEFCKTRNCKIFLNFGSCFEYGTLDNATTLLTEDAILKPDDIYGGSKVACENFINVYGKVLGIKVVTLRPFSLFGKYEKDTRLLPLIFKSGFMNNSLSLTGGEQIRDYMSVNDLVMCVGKLIDNAHKINHGEAINICSAQAISIKDFIYRVINVCKFDSNLFLFGRLKYRNNESMYFVGDNKKLFTIIGYQDLSLKDEDIQNAFEYFKNNLKQ